MFDLQAHRGGSGLTVENTLAAFRTALALGVRTLECDVHVSADGVAMVTHDPVVSARSCRDTGAETYVGRRVADLTAAQLRTLDCGSLNRPDLPRQRAVPGERMPTLPEVLDLVVGLPGLRVNVETKLGAIGAAEAALRGRFVKAVLGAIRAAGLVDRVSVQSFDWAMLRLVGRASPRTGRYVLTSPERLEAGRPGASPWLGGLDVDDLPAGPEGLAAAAAAQGFTALSPVHGTPASGAMGDAGYTPYVTARLVNAAHRHGLLVVPWTVNDRATATALLDLGVDGLITDYPDVLREVLAERGVALPDPVVSGG